MNVKKIMECLSEEDIIFRKEHAIEMETYAGQTLDDIVIKLEKLRKQGKLNYYAKFNGIKLYSLDVTMNSAFKECLNCTRKTWLKKEKEWLSNVNKNKEQVKEKLPLWIEEGKKYIHPEKHSIWEQSCYTFAYGDNDGLEIEKTIEIMNMLASGKSLIEIKEKILNENYSGVIYNRITSLVLLYAKRGPALYKLLNHRYSYNEGKKYIQKIEELNRKITMGYKYDDVVESLKEHKIVDISITDVGEEYANIGTLLMDGNNYFEGVLENSEYVAGQILEDGSISLATFCNYKKSSHFYGVNQNGSISAEHEIYSISDGITNVGKSNITLSETEKDYIDEINIENRIKTIKEYFDNDTKSIYDWFYRNFASEFGRSVSLLRDDLNQRLVNSLANKQHTLTKSLKNNIVNK